MGVVIEEEPLPTVNVTGANQPGQSGIQKPVSNLTAAIEQLHFNVTVGMLSIPNLIYLQAETTTGSQAAGENQWAFDWVQLVALYGAFLLVNLIAGGVAVAAIDDNGGIGIHNNGFVLILPMSCVMENILRR